MPIRRPGQALLLSTVLLAVVMALVGAFISYLGGVNKATQTFTGRAAARQAAQAGIEKALWCLNQSDGANCGGTFGGDYIGETNVAVGQDTWFTTTITSISGNEKTITSTGFYPSISAPETSVKIKAEATIDTSAVSFFYGLQTGYGGVELEENSTVIGNVYANGDIKGKTGGSNQVITGDVWVAGGTAQTPDQEQTTNNEGYDFGKTNPVVDIAQSFKLSSDNVVNKVSLYLKKTGNPSDKTVYIVQDNGGVPSDDEGKIEKGTLKASNVTSSFGWVDVTLKKPAALLGNQTYWLLIDSSAKSSKYYTIGSLPNNGYGNGVGMYASNWKSGSPNWSSAGRDFAFKIWVGGVTTKIEEASIQGHAHANTIIDSTISGDAYYQTISGTTVGGTQYPGSADPSPTAMPISDAQINQWVSEATAGGTTLGDVTISGASNTLGPQRITGNLVVQNGASLTLTGTVYVEGSITLTNNATLQLDSSYGANSGILMSDGPFIINNNVNFYGSGTSGSYFMALTTYPSVAKHDPAMDIKNNVTGDVIYYASRGSIKIENNATLKEVTAFQLEVENNASIQYEQGLANINFSSGPGGSWVIKPGSVREIH